MAADPTTSKPHGFAHLAKRISAWTTNGLLTLVILLAGLVFGRQVLKWWAADATPPAETSVAPLASDGLGDPAKAHFLQFGNQPWAIERQEIRGDKEQAAAALRCNAKVPHHGRRRRLGTADNPGRRAVPGAAGPIDALRRGAGQMAAVPAHGWLPDDGRRSPGAK